MCDFDCECIKPNIYELHILTILRKRTNDRKSAYSRRYFPRVDNITPGGECRMGEGQSAEKPIIQISNRIISKTINRIVIKFYNCAQSYKKFTLSSTTTKSSTLSRHFDSFHRCWRDVYRSTIAHLYLRVFPSRTHISKKVYHTAMNFESLFPQALSFLRLFIYFFFFGETAAKWSSVASESIKLRVINMQSTALSHRGK